MKFSIDRASLLRSLSHVQSAVERRNTIPILANVLLRAEGNSLSLSTTDMDLEIDETFWINNERRGDNNQIWRKTENNKAINLRTGDEKQFKNIDNVFMRV